MHTHTYAYTYGHMHTHTYTYTYGHTHAVGMHWYRVVPWALATTFLRNMIGPKSSSNWDILDLGAYKCPTPGENQNGGEHS